jgi:hypothetical protein
MMEGVNSTTIYCKNFCKYHNVQQYPSTTIIFKKRGKKKKEMLRNIFQQAKINLNPKE